MTKPFEVGQYIYCGTGSDSGSGCPGGTVESCTECGEGLCLICPCGCISFQDCDCEYNDFLAEIEQ